MEVPIPFTGESIDTGDDKTSIVLTVGGVAAGFAVLAMVQDLGSNAYQSANSFVTNYTGFTLGGDDSGGQGGV